jgi:group I intron endonuclease
MAIGIYKIQSISHPERCYIGSSNNIKRRKTEHLYRLGKNKHDSLKLQNHYNKYGKDDLVFSVLIECPKERIVIKEQCFLNIYKPWFNISLTAGSTFGTTHSVDFCKKISLFQSTRVHSKEQNEKISRAQQGENNSFFGKHHTVESNEKRRQWNLKHPPTKETREKQRVSLLKTLEKKRLELIKQN